MNDSGMWLGLALGFLVSGFIFVTLLFARAGDLSRAWWALGVAGLAKQNPSLQTKIDAALGTPGPAVTPLPPPPVATVPPPPQPKSPPPPPPVQTKSPPPAPQPKSPPPAPAKPSGEPLRLLALLQSESRLLDFLMEDVSGATDAQVGAGVKEIHKKAAAALKKYLVVEAVLPGADGDRVTVAKGYDPSAVRVVGNVTGEPPYTGELQHPGWRVKELKLPIAAEGQDPFVVQPAEVQV